MLDHPIAKPARRPIFLSPEAELRRLDSHFRRVIARLRRQPPPGLGRAQRRARGRHIEVLEAYRRGRSFPKNHAFPGLMIPIFVDAAGTRCAMGHLIEQAGGGELVQQVAATRNYDRIRELADLPELLAWLDANGLTVEEAGLIQPTYCEAPKQCVCHGLVSENVLEGTIQADPAGTLLVTGVHGTAEGLVVGDVLPFTSRVDGVKGGDLVLAAYDTSANMPAANVWQLLDASGQITITKCTWFGDNPGPLPASVYAEAKVAADADACAAVLGEYDEGWLQYHGDACDEPSTSSGGTSMGTGGSGGGGSAAGGSGGKTEMDGGGCGIHPGEAHGTVLSFALLAGLCAAHGLRLRLRGRR